VDADLSKYFDTIPHDELMQSVARRIVDRNMLHLIKMWLKVPAEEQDESGRRQMTGGRNSRSGTPQGGIVSPLFANLYMNRFLKHWRKTGKSEIWEACIISYADDFVREGSTGMDAGGYAAPGTYAERGEDQHQGCPPRTFSNTRLDRIAIARRANGIAVPARRRKVNNESKRKSMSCCGPI
jgi:reverse transcriptase-like protein